MPLTGRTLELTLEAFGTFFVTYFYATGVSFIANGLVLMALVYLSKQAGWATAFNPAITFMQWLCGKLGEGMKDWKTLLLYWGVQFAAAVPAAILGYATRPDDGVVACIGKGKYYNIVEGFMNEYIWTIAFCYVFMVMFYEKELAGNNMYGLVIGFMYMVMGMSKVISGGGYNPAMATGLWFSSSFMKPSGNDCFVDGWGYIWYFLGGPIGGAATAWLMYKFMHMERFAKFHDYAMEFIGTFFITFAACLTIVGGSNFDVGTCIAIFIYVGHYKQSGFYNPVYTLAAFINGGLPLLKFALYTAAQCAGSFSAALMAYLITRYGSSDGQDFLDAGGSALEPYRPRAAAKLNKFGALLAELFATTFVTVMYLAVSARLHKSGRVNNPLYGLMIGWTVAGAAMTVGVYTFSYFNPAIWVGSSFIYLFADGGDDFGEIYIYAISGFGGCALGAFFYKFLVGHPYEGTAFDSEEGKSLREREDMRRQAQVRRGQSASGGNTVAGAKASEAQPAAGTDGKGAPASQV